jgi:hypothetical protein
MLNICSVFEGRNKKGVTPSEACHFRRGVHPGTIGVLHGGGNRPLVPMPGRHPQSYSRPQRYNIVIEIVNQVDADTLQMRRQDARQK